MIRLHLSLNTLRDTALHTHSTLERRARSASSRSSADASLLSSWSRVFPFGRLASEQKRLRILSFAADLEGAEILVPRSIRRLGFRLPPRLQLVEVLGGDLALAQPLEQVVAKRRRKSGPGSSASLTEGHAGEFFLETFLLR